jgi:AcrR family transcriptional regulator
MRVSEKSRSRSFTATARRAQIIEATIEILAESGYAQATFSRIAERAGLSSTRLISYHFAGKQDLIDAVVQTVYAAIGAHMTGRMADLPDLRTTLRTYISALVDFIASHQAQMQALMTVFLDHRDPAGDPGYDAETDAEVTTPLQQILSAGQDSGEFRRFDTFVMATTIQRSIDGLPFLLRGTPDLDLADYAEELSTLFDLATRAPR